MDETEHFASVIHLGAHVFEVSPKNHVLVQLQTFFFRNKQIGESGGGFWLLDRVGDGDDGGGLTVGGSWIAFVEAEFVVVVLEGMEKGFDGRSGCAIGGGGGGEI